jgi:hypothetical protein
MRFQLKPQGAAENRGEIFTIPCRLHLLSLRFGCGRPTSRGRSLPDGGARLGSRVMAIRMVISSSVGSGMAVLWGAP